MKKLKSNQAWKTFDFGPNLKSPKKNGSPVTNPDEYLHEQKVFSFNKPKKPSFDFLHQLTPKHVSDLAVHQKKIEEVKLWLEANTSTQNKKYFSFLLLSGPTGSGKTTTLNVLCKDMGISISEWINPVDQDFELVRGPNQISKFLEFISTETNYSSLLEISTQNRLVLVEDFPNTFLKNPSEFGNILEECSYKCQYPIVFICTDIANNKMNLVYNLFPQETLNKFNITHISFNSCAPTLLKNSLKRAHDLVQKNKEFFKTPSKSIVDAILSSSMGDIRCAVNQYYFASLIGSNQLPTTESNMSTKQGLKRKRSEKSLTIKIMAKDETLGLFHALGRILNPKRKEHINSWRLNCDLNSLIAELESQPESVISFLFANYIKYFGDFNDLQKASDLICVSQKFFDKWIERNDLYQYPLWISVLGLMTVNNHKVSKWNQIEGPKKIMKNTSKMQNRSCVLDEYYINLIRSHPESN